MFNVDKKGTARVRRSSAISTTYDEKLNEKRRRAGKKGTIKEVTHANRTHD